MTRSQVERVLNDNPMIQANAVMDALLRDLHAASTQNTDSKNVITKKKLTQYVPEEFIETVLKPMEATIDEANEEQEALKRVLEAAARLNSLLTLSDPPKKTLGVMRNEMEQLRRELAAGNHRTDAVDAFIARLATADRWVSGTGGSVDPDNPDVFDDDAWNRLTHEQRERAMQQIQERIDVPAMIGRVRDDAYDVYSRFRRSGVDARLREFQELLPVWQTQKEADDKAGEYDKSIPSVNLVRDKVNKLSTKLVLMSQALTKMEDDVARGDNVQHVNEIEGMKKAGMTWAGMRDYVDKKLSYTQEAQRRLALIERFETLEDTQLPPLRVLDMMRQDALRERDARRKKNEYPYRSIVSNEELRNANEYPERRDIIDDELRAIERARQALLRRDGGLPDVSSDDAWKNASIADREKALDLIRAHLGIDVYLKSTQDLADRIGKSLKTDENKVDVDVGNRVKEVQLNLAETQEENPLEKDTNIFDILMNVRGTWEQMKQTLGIEFYTPMQLWMAFQELKEAFEEVRKQNDRLKASKLSALAGRALAPILGHDFELILENSQVKKNDEVKNGFLEALKSNSWDPGFDDMFMAGGILDQNLHDKNRTRAIIEFAASKGMLYDTSDEKASENKLLFGRWRYRDLVPGEWSDGQINSYWGNLSAENAMNTKKRAEIGKDLVKNVEKAEDFIKKITDTIKGHDLWIAKGMIERAFDKGKDGKFSAWMAVTLMELLRTDPILRKYAPVEWLDQVGIISAKTAAFTMGHLNFHRNAFIMPWLRSGEQSLSGAGNLGQVIEDVKNEFLTIDRTLDPEAAGLSEKTRKERWEKLNEMVGRVLATQKVEHKGHIVTIFDEKFNYYNAGSGMQREVDVKELSDDFFNDQSEILLCDAHIIAKILQYGSTRLFDYDFRAKKLFSHAVRARQELMKSYKEYKTTNPTEADRLFRAAERFRTTFGEKMEKKFRELFRQSGTMTLTEFTLDDEVRPALAAMVQEGFVSLQTMEEGLQTSEGSKFARAILEQCVGSPDTPRDLDQRIRHLLDEHKKRQQLRNAE